MERTVVEADCVDIYCYWGAQMKLVDTLEEVSIIEVREGKIVKVAIFVEDLRLREHSAICQAMRNSFRETFRRYSINILMLGKRQEIGQLLEQIRNMNSIDFQCNYLRVQGLAAQKIESNMLKDFIQKKFKWNDVKTKYFLEKNKIAEVRKLVCYNGYPHWEHKVVEKTRLFKKFCENREKRESKGDNSRVC